jgi:hypothetical protein
MAGKRLMNGMSACSVVHNPPTQCAADEYRTKMPTVQLAAISREA